MMSEETIDFSYCRMIVHHQLEYVKACTEQAEYDYAHGATISLFAMLWLEGYVNHIVQILFPDKWDKNEAQRFFRGKYAGVKGKVKFIAEELAIKIEWPDALQKLLDFRNRVCHGRIAEREVVVDESAKPPIGFTDDFNLVLGTISEVRGRVVAAESWMKELHQTICGTDSNHQLYLAQKEKGRDIDVEQIKDPLSPVLSSRFGPAYPRSPD